jgi:hypothetical protein
VLIHNGPFCENPVIASSAGPFREVCAVWVDDPNSQSPQKVEWVVTNGGYASAAVLPAQTHICAPGEDPADFGQYQ